MDVYMFIFTEVNYLSFKKNLFLILKGKVTERKKYLFTSSQLELGQAEATSFWVCYGGRFLCCFPLHINRELDEKRSNSDSNREPYRMWALQAAN